MLLKLQLDAALLCPAAGDPDHSKEKGLLAQSTACPTPPTADPSHRQPARVSRGSPGQNEMAVPGRLGVGKVSPGPQWMSSGMSPLSQHPYALQGALPSPRSMGIDFDHWSKVVKTFFFTFYCIFRGQFFRLWGWAFFTICPHRSRYSRETGFRLEQ